MSIECLLDNCPHHATKTAPPEKVGMVCRLKICAWDSPTITGYLDAVRDPNTDDSLFIEEAKIIVEDQSCNSSQEEST